MPLLEPLLEPEALGARVVAAGELGSLLGVADPLSRRALGLALPLAHALGVPPCCGEALPHALAAPLPLAQPETTPVMLGAMRLGVACAEPVLLLLAHGDAEAVCDAAALPLPPPAASAGEPLLLPLRAGEAVPAAL